MKNLWKILLHLVLGVFSLIMIMPFVWMLLTSLKSPAESIEFPPKWIPAIKYYVSYGNSTEEIIIKNKGKDKWKGIIKAGRNRGKVLIVKKEEIHKKRFLWENYLKAWKSAPFGLYFFNSFFTAVVTTVAQLLTSALAAYAFAKLKFPFKNVLFIILLATLMVPKQVILIPNYVILAKLGWINTYKALTVPWLASVFSIYFMRQFFESIPNDLFAAAKIDGCTHWQTLTQVVIPLSTSVFVTTGLFTFIASWNSLLWPLIVTNSPSMRTLQVGLTVFNQESGTNWTQLMAASTFSLAPLIIVFFLAQKTFIEGIAASGLKE